MKSKFASKYKTSSIVIHIVEFSATSAYCKCNKEMCIKFKNIVNTAGTIKGQSIIY